MFSLLLAVAACGEGAAGGGSGGAAATADKGKLATPQANVAVDRSHAGTPAPAVAFETRDGNRLTVASFAGKPVLVNLWATWCAPCKVEMPELESLAGARRGQLSVVALSQDVEGWQAVDTFFTPDRFPELVPYLDQKMAFAQAVGAKGLPMTILYDASGQEVWRVSRPLPWAGPAVAPLFG